MKRQHEFSQVPTAKIPRSSFNLSHPHKTTFDADWLIPICQPIDIIPGDTFSMKTSFFIRLNTMLRPILDGLTFETFAFFVPNRLLWVNHEKFHGAQDDPGDSIDFTIPTKSVNSANLNSIYDYFGIPKITGAIPISALPFRAYTMIWDDWFRNQNLQDKEGFSTADGPDAQAFVIKKRGKRRDYFTSCLPWPQKGTAVSMPLGSQAPVVGIGRLSGQSWSTSAKTVYETDNASTQSYTRNLDGTTAGIVIEGDLVDTNEPAIYADLSNATAANINAIRLAFQTQRLLERDARSGTRYIEALKAHWGVTSPDFRLQRPEFLGGGSSRIITQTVAQQSAQGTPTETDKVGNLAANGIVSGTHSWSKSFVEHGLVIILGNIRGEITYSQGIDRYWSKTTRYETFYPVLSGIGEQSVLNREIWADASANDDLVFGYQGRYDEYRFLNGKLTSLMRPDAAGTLASWHLSEDFATLPTLGDTFFQANTGVPLDRAIAVPSQPQFYADFWHEIKAARPLPVYGVPGNIDHF